MHGAPPRHTGRSSLGLIALPSALLVSFCSACSSQHEQDLPDDVLWESTHFRYHTRSGDTAPCEAVLGQLERHFELLQSYLGFPWPAGRKVDYYKFRDNADYARNADCPHASGSCATGSSVRSPYVLQDHELVHAYLAPLGLPPAFFTEGAAEALACNNVVAIEDPKAWQEVVNVPFSDDRRAHYEGAWFVGYLLHRYGPESFLALYERLDYETATVDKIAAAFESVYGEPLDTVWTAGLSFTNHVVCVNLWNCSGSALPLDGSFGTLEQACDGSDNSRTFELDSDTDVLISSQRYFLNAPLSCDEELPYYVGGNSVSWEYGTVFDPTVVSVPAGRYFVSSAAQGGLADVAIRPLPKPTYSRDCGDLQPLELGGDEFWKGDVELAIPNDGDAWYVKLHPVSGTTVYTGSEPTEAVEECTSCEDAPVCEPLADDAHPDADGNVTLRLTSPATGPGYRTYLIRTSFLPK